MLFREVSNSRWTFRFNALSRPIRAIMVGPLSSTTRSRASTGGLPLLEILLGLGKLLDIVCGVLEGNEAAATGQGNGIEGWTRDIAVNL
jgi:hypothetical protein